MINVCGHCFRLNPLGEKYCLYCAGVCRAIKSEVYSQFRQEQGEIHRLEEERFQAEEGGFPDLKVFEDCVNLGNPEVIIFARP